MTWAYTYIPGQLSLPNYIDVFDPVDPEEPPPGGVAFFPGQIAKIESYQYNRAMTTNHAHMPNPYNPNLAAHVDTIWGELDRKAWLNGILIEASWGEVEGPAGVFDFEFIDFVMNSVRGLQRPTGQNKKVWILLNFRLLASLTGVGNLIPSDLLTQNMAVNGGYYKNPTTFPPSQTNPIVNAKKYDNLWCYEAADPNVLSAEVMPRGYNMNLYKFANLLEPNTLMTRYFAFIDAIADHFSDDPVFGGIITTEAATGNPFTGYLSGNGRDPHYAGRKNIAITIKEKFPNHMVAECVNFDRTYYQEMTNVGVTEGLIKYKLSFTTANYHLGTNLNLGNIIPVLAGKVPIVMQVQGLDMRSMSGNSKQYYNYPTNPTQVLGAADSINNNDPPTPQWCMDRLKYFKANMAIIQRNYDTSKDAPGVVQMNWPRWKTFMDASAYANDQYGGMVSTKPLFVG